MEYLILNKDGQKKLGMKRIVLSNIVRLHNHVIIWK